MTSAHRVAWELSHGALPPHLFVCHDCPGGDNLLCVRPDHMFLGDHQANAQDASAKGMMHQGENHWRTSLTNGRVLAIRACYAAGGLTYAELAAEFSLSVGCVYKIVRRIRWHHI